MDFIDEFGPGDAGDFRGGPDVIRIGRRGDDDIGKVRGQFASHAADLCRELQHIEQALGAIAGVGVGAQPEIIDAVDLFTCDGG